jgi:DNA (cytosine-5)-methyltransferase 1
LSKNADGMGVQAAAAVRRLTPVECERLQGWPDGWTLLDGPSLVDAPRWFEPGYVPNESMPAPDGRRYAACGDGVTATVSEWLGRRIMELCPET